MNRQCRLTDTVVATCVPTHAEYSVRDTVLRGLALRVRRSGARTWILRGHGSDPTARITLGDARLLTVDQARTKARVLITTGVVPPVLPIEASPLFRDFARLHRERRGLKWKPSTLQCYDSYLRTALLPAFGRKRLIEITRVEVARWFHRYSRRTPGGANRAFDVLKEMFNRAKEWAVVPVTHANPCLRIRKNRRPPRGRLLNNDALGKLGGSLDRLFGSHPDEVDAIRLILLTGCRSGEIFRLRWSEVFADRLALADSKTGARTVRIGIPASKLLERRRPSAGSPFVFPLPRNPDKPLRGISEVWAQARAGAGLSDDIRLHDLRHTFASHAVMAGESLLITGALLGHRRAESTMRYSHLNDSFLLKAADKVGKQIHAWMAEGS